MIVTQKKERNEEKTGKPFNVYFELIIVRYERKKLVSNECIIMDRLYK